jgi:4-hydroxybenzoate polyprenyltransferase
VRLSLALSPVADVLAGAAVSAMQGPIRVAGVAVAAPASLLLYLGGMALNGIVDLEQDRREAPGRPLPSGEIRVFTAWIVTVVCLVLGLVLAHLASPRVLALAGAIVLLIVVYHFPLKSHDIAGPVALGVIRGANLVLGMEAARPIVPGFTSMAFVPAVLYGLYVFGTSLVARMEDSDFELGRFRAGLGLAIAALLLLAAVHGSMTTPLYVLFALPVAAIFGLVVVMQAIPIGRARGPRPAVRKLVILMLSGFYLADAIIALGAGSLVAAVVIAGLFPASRWLARTFPPS